MIWDPVFGWDVDRIRLMAYTLAFVFLFSGFIASTEGLGFFYPTLSVVSYVQAHDIQFLAGLIVFSMGVFAWWRRVNGWV